MSESIIKNVKAYWAGYDLSGDITNTTVTYSNDLQDNTTHGSSFRKRLSGLKNIEISVDGYVNTAAGKSDRVLFPNIGSTEDVVSVCPSGTSLSERAFFTKGVAGEYTPGGTIGGMYSFTANLMGCGEILVRGKTAENGALTSSGTNNPVELGFRSTNQKLYAALHILSVSSSNATFDAQIETDNSSSFGSPSTAIEFTQVSDTSPGTAQWASTACSTGDDWYRLKWQTGTTQTSVTLAAVIGLG